MGKQVQQHPGEQGLGKGTQGIRINTNTVWPNTPRSTWRPKLHCKSKRYISGVSNQCKRSIFCSPYSNANREVLFSPLDSLPHSTFCHPNLQEKFGRRRQQSRLPKRHREYGEVPGFWLRHRHAGHSWQQPEDRHWSQPRLRGLFLNPAPSIWIWSRKELSKLIVWK